MAEPSSTKLDPAEEAKQGLEPQLAKDETEKVTAGATELKDKDEKPAEGSGVTDKVAGAASATTSAVFSMFGGGPKKEKKEEEDVDEPSGSSKAKKADDVSGILLK